MQVSETTAAAKIDEGISRGFARINADLKKSKPFLQECGADG